MFDLTSPDASQRRAQYQSRPGAPHQGDETLDFGRISHDGVGNGRDSNAGNRFVSATLPDTIPEEEDLFGDGGKEEQVVEAPPPPAARAQSPPPPPPAPESEDKTSIYEGGLYWKFLELMCTYFEQFCGPRPFVHISCTTPIKPSSQG